MRYAAQIISIIFHPLLVLTYMLILLLLVNPYLFGVNNLSDKESLKFVICFFYVILDTRFRYFYDVAFEINKQYPNAR